MKIAHFAIFAPHASGQYGTVKDLILSERALGIDAQFIDCGKDGKETVRAGLEDGEICTQPIEWADSADVIIRHSHVPKRLYGAKPVILAMHGRPENSFRLEQYETSPIITTIKSELRAGYFSAIFTFWKEHVYPLSKIYGVPVNYVPPPVNFNDYRLDGEAHDFGNFKAKINLIVTDMWREDRTPFNLVFGAQYFKDHYQKDTKLHIYGAPTKKCGFLSNLQKKGVVGEVSGVVGWLPKVYRSADILLTPHLIATRTIREAMAFGVPIVGPPGCKYTPYTAEPSDYARFAKAINACYENMKPRTEIREQATKIFDFNATALAVKNLCDRVLQNPWNSMSITKDDWEVLKGFIDTNKIKHVSEFGAGVSTRLLSKHGVKVESFEAQAKRVNGDISFWDGKSDLDLRGDLILIDGPYGGKNREHSYRNALESDVPFVACHDMARKEDRVWVDKYFSSWKPVIGTTDLLILERPC